MTALMIKPEDMYHPLELAELISVERDWSCDRTDEGEVLTQAVGMWGHYQLWFYWQESMSALTVSCSFDTRLPQPMLPKLHALLALVNEKLWAGHFCLNSQDMTIGFRHTLLLAEDDTNISAQLSQLVDLAMSECDRFYPALQSVSWGGKTPQEALEYALFETVAEA